MPRKPIDTAPKDGTWITVIGSAEIEGERVPTRARFAMRGDWTSGWYDENGNWIWGVDEYIVQEPQLKRKE